MDLALQAPRDCIHDGSLPPARPSLPSLTKRQIFQCEDDVRELFDPITICRDVHGQLYDVFELFDRAGSQIRSFLFLGNDVDRGGFSIQTVLYLLIKKIESPFSFFRLPGNQQSRIVNETLGLSEECCRFDGCRSLWLCSTFFLWRPLFRGRSLLSTAVFPRI
jgi:hypothetical protein